MIFAQIKELLCQIKTLEHEHKVTIFNKEKNNLNKHLHNVAEGKLIHLLKNYPYFSQLNDQFGAVYLMRVLEHIQPYFLRKGKTLVNLKEDNFPTEYVMVGGVMKLFEFVYETSQSIKDKDNINNEDEDEDLDYVDCAEDFEVETVRLQKFRKYLSNGFHINMAEYRETEFKIVSHQNCEMIKLPNKAMLDPIKRSKKLTELNRLTDKNVDIQQIVDSLQKMKTKISKVNRNVEIDTNFGLGVHDYQELILASQLMEVNKKQTIYEEKQSIDRIGLILKGKVMQEEKKMKYHKSLMNNVILSFYKKDYKEDHKKIEKHQLPLEEGEWVGLEEYMNLLQQSPTRMQYLTDTNQDYEQVAFETIFTRFKLEAKREIFAAENLLILWIPVEMFATKFNFQLNFNIMDRWAAMLQIKEDNKRKNDELKSKLEGKDEIPREIIEFPKILKDNLAKMGHDVDDLEEMTEKRVKIIIQKQKKLNKYAKKSKITSNSLLGITMADTVPVPLFEDLTRAPKISFSSYTKETLNKKYFAEKKPKKIVRKENHKSDNKLLSEMLKSSDDSPEDLIMYPEAYEAKNLPPDLRKEMMFAERLNKNQTIDYSVNKRDKPYESDTTKTQSMNHSMVEESPKKIIESVQAQLSPLVSKASIEVGYSTDNSPQKIYKNILSKISYKYPHLEQCLTLEKDQKRKINSVRKITLKQRIETLKEMEDNQRRRLKRSYLQTLKEKSFVKQF